MDKEITIVVADDHPLFREGVVVSIEADKRLALIGQAGTVDEAKRLCEQRLPDILLLDINMPGDGLIGAREIIELCPAVRIIILTASESDKHVSEALELGARGYVLKGVGATELARTIFAVHSGETYVTPSLAARVLKKMHTRLNAPPADDFPILTPREEQILGYVSLGHTNKEIASRLGISEKTVKHYMTNIMQKLQVRNRVEAVLAVRDRHQRSSSKGVGTGRPAQTR